MGFVSSEEKKLGVVVHACNPCFLGKQKEENCQFEPGSYEILSQKQNKNKIKCLVQEAEHLPGMYETLVSISNTTGKEKKRKRHQSFLPLSHLSTRR
jgi:hypothetical protein